MHFSIEHLMFLHSLSVYVLIKKRWCYFTFNHPCGQRSRSGHHLVLARFNFNHLKDKLFSLIVPVYHSSRELYLAGNCLSGDIWQFRIFNFGENYKIYNEVFNTSKVHTHTKGPWQTMEGFFLVMWNRCNRKKLKWTSLVCNFVS